MNGEGVPNRAFAWKGESQSIAATKKEKNGGGEAPPHCKKNVIRPEIHADGHRRGKGRGLKGKNRTAASRTSSVPTRGSKIPHGAVDKLTRNWRERS